MAKGWSRPRTPAYPQLGTGGGESRSGTLSGRSQVQVLLGSPSLSGLVQCGGKNHEKRGPCLPGPGKPVQIGPCRTSVSRKILRYQIGVSVPSDTRYPIVGLRRDQHSRTQQSSLESSSRALGASGTVGLSAFVCREALRHYRAGPTGAYLDRLVQIGAQPASAPLLISGAARRPRLASGHAQDGLVVVDRAGPRLLDNKVDSDGQKLPPPPTWGNGHSRHHIPTGCSATTHSQNRSASSVASCDRTAEPPLFSSPPDTASRRDASAVGAVPARRVSRMPPRAAQPPLGGATMPQRPLCQPLWGRWRAPPWTLCQSRAGGAAAQGKIMRSLRLASATRAGLACPSYWMSLPW